MKANKLMIGDIVEVNNTPLRIAALGTAKAGFIDAKGEMFYHYYDNIKPIPLTEEILESNGFVQVDKHEYSVMDSYYNYLKVRCYADTYYEIGNAFDEKGELQAFADIQYVHELQHALKLCGIDKNIKL